MNKPKTNQFSSPFLNSLFLPFIIKLSGIVIPNDGPAYDGTFKVLLTQGKDFLATLK